MSDDYDGTPLLHEEKTEKFYLDKKRFISIELPENKWHPTAIENVIPSDFLYKAEDILDSEDYEWELTYQFSSSFRNPFKDNTGQYGNIEMTYRRLYIILCEKFNDGQYFIDTYFDSVYPSTIKTMVEERLRETKEAYLSLASEAITKTRITKGGTLDLRYKINKELMTLGSEIAEQDADIVTAWIKQDIEACLMSGQIPLNFNPSFTTIDIREKLGIDSKHGFYATGQLIQDLRIFFKLKRKTWKTTQGILV